METSHALLSKRYDDLWRESSAAIRQGAEKIDPVLAAGTADTRRGLTLVARPGANVRRQVSRFLKKLQTIDPHQHYYPPAELHVTILGLFTATRDCEPFFSRAQEYRDATAAAVSGARAFGIDFAGITASSGAVLIQGFPLSEELESIRARLRSELKQRGLAGGLDQRYRRETAHLTAVRFCHRLHERDAFVRVLEEHRNWVFGTTNVRELSLVKNDWYLSAEVVETLRIYPLQNRSHIC